MPRKRAKSRANDINRLDLIQEIVRILVSVGESGINSRIQAIQLTQRLNQIFPNYGNGITSNQRTNRYLKKIYEEGRHNVHVEIGGTVYTPVECPDEWIRGYIPGWFIPSEHKLSRCQKELAIHIALEQAPFLMPPRQKKYISDALQKNKSLDKHYHKDNKKWMGRIEVQSRYPALFVRDQDKNAVDNESILEALFDQYGFKAQYVGQSKKRVYHPLRLLRRERVSYIICKVEGSEKYKSFAVHRFTGAEVVYDKIDKKHYDKDNIKNNLKTKISGPWGLMTEPFIFTITNDIDGGPAQHLSEMCFHEGAPKKTIVFKDRVNGSGKAEQVTITVQDLEFDYELYTWILGLGRFIKVSSPQNVVDYLAAQIRSMLANY